MDFKYDLANNSIFFKNGLLSAQPFIVGGISSVFLSWCSDRIIVAKKFNLITVRKTFNTIGLVGPALMLTGLSFVSCDHLLAILMLSLSLFFCSATYSGFGVNFIIFEGFSAYIYLITTFQQQIILLTMVTFQIP